jgi:hypothetical protein
LYALPKPDTFARISSPEIYRNHHRRLLQLSGLPNLKTLMFSADDGEDIHGKLLQLHDKFPDCELVVDGKVQHFDE